MRARQGPIQPKLLDAQAEPCAGVGKNLKWQKGLAATRTSYLWVFSPQAFNGGWLPLNFAISATNSSIRFSIA